MVLNVCTYHAGIILIKCMYICVFCCWNMQERAVMWHGRMEDCQGLKRSTGAVLLTYRWACNAVMRHKVGWTESMLRMGGVLTHSLTVISCIYEVCRKVNSSWLSPHQLFSVSVQSLRTLAHMHTHRPIPYTHNSLSTISTDTGTLQTESPATKVASGLRNTTPRIHRYITLYNRL